MGSPPSVWLGVHSRVDELVAEEMRTGGCWPSAHLFIARDNHDSLLRVMTALLLPATSSLCSSKPEPHSKGDSGKTSSLYSRQGFGCSAHGKESPLAFRTPKLLIENKSPSLPFTRPSSCLSATTFLLYLILLAKFLSPKSLKCPFSGGNWHITHTSLRCLSSSLQ